MSDQLKAIVYTALTVLAIIILTTGFFVLMEWMYATYGMIAAFNIIIFVPLGVATGFLVYLLYDITLWQIRMKKDDE